MIRKLKIEDIDSCSEILMSVYNNEHWQCNWDFKTARAYLMDYFEANKFIGYVKILDKKICGAIFCHEKIWWNNSEVFVDEMFVLPEFQGQGYGSELLKKVEEYITEHNLAGFTLSTNRFTKAPNFYKKNGFKNADHVLFMYKEI